MQISDRRVSGPAFRLCLKLMKDKVNIKRLLNCRAIPILAKILKKKYATYLSDPDIPVKEIGHPLELEELSRLCRGADAFSLLFQKKKEAKTKEENALKAAAEVSSLLAKDEELESNKGGGNSGEVDKKEKSSDTTASSSSDAKDSDGTYKAMKKFFGSNALNTDNEPKQAASSLWKQAGHGILLKKAKEAQANSKSTIHSIDTENDVFKVMNSFAKVILYLFC
jgi:hypothetical protein